MGFNAFRAAQKIEAIERENGAKRHLGDLGD